MLECVSVASFTVSSISWNVILYKHKSINTFEGSIIIMSTLMDMTVEIGQVEPEPEEPGDVEPEPAPEPGQAKETEDDSQQ
jgi:hypothetical protein